MQTQEEPRTGHEQAAGSGAAGGAAGAAHEVVTRRGRWSAVGRARARLDRAVAQGAEAGMATAEYAIATVAAAGFAGLLIAILRSDEVRGLLLDIVRGALST